MLLICINNCLKRIIISELLHKNGFKKYLKNIVEGLKNTVYELTVSSIPQDNVQYLHKYVNDGF